MSTQLVLLQCINSNNQWLTSENNYSADIFNIYQVPYLKFISDTGFYFSKKKPEFLFPWNLIYVTT